MYFNKKTPTIKKTFLLHLLGIFFISTLLLSFFSPPAKADSGRYLFDFGSALVQTTPGWNNIVDSQVRDTITNFPVIDSTNGSTSATLRFTDPFNCIPSGAPVNGNGTWSSTVYPASATLDTVFLGLAGGGVCTQTDNSGAFTLSGLNTQNSTYDVRFYASRTGDNSNRTTNYTIGSTTVSLNATNNVNNFVTIPNVTPNNGTIAITVSKAPVSAMYGYLGVLEVIRETNNSTPTANAGVDQTITLPTHEITLTGSGTDPDGTITNYKWAEISAGGSSIGSTIVSPNSASTTVTDLAAGFYIFQLTVTDNIGSTGVDYMAVFVQPEAIASCPAQKVVVLGSSTAQGYSANPINYAWVNLYYYYLYYLNPANAVINLAQGGYTSYHILPTGSNPPFLRPAPDTARNITAAIAQNPDAIIVNMPTNDIGNGYSVSEFQNNLQTVANVAAAANIPIWITTTQPRNSSQSQRNDLMTVRDWIKSTYPTRSLDFWTTLANGDGTIASPYSAGDGVHLNNLGHQKLYNRVAGSNILGTLCNP